MKKEVVKQCLKSIIFTIAPFLIPLIFMVPDIIINEFAKGIIVVILLFVDIYFVLLFSRRDAITIYKSEKNLYDYKGVRISRSIINRLSNCEKIKSGLIKDETYKVHYDYKENILLYNPHRYLERVCDEIKSLISDVTGIELEYISVSFIYHYPVYSDKWSDWQWITGKDSSASLTLDELIRKPDSYYHYLISNNIPASFENDKGKLIPHHYWTGERDIRHNIYGSISSHKISFRNNNSTFCSGYLTISTYGKKFYSCLSGDLFTSEDEFEQILFDYIIPPFRKLIEAELGFLYMRHKYRIELGIDADDHI